MWGGFFAHFISVDAHLLWGTFHEQLDYFGRTCIFCATFFSLGQECANSNSCSRLSSSNLISMSFLPPLSLLLLTWHLEMCSFLNSEAKVSWYKMMNTATAHSMQAENWTKALVEPWAPSVVCNSSKRLNQCLTSSLFFITDELCIRVEWNWHADNSEYPSKWRYGESQVKSAFVSQGLREEGLNCHPKWNFSFEDLISLIFTKSSLRRRRRMLLPSECVEYTWKSSSWRAATTPTWTWSPKIHCPLWSNQLRPQLRRKKAWIESINGKRSLTNVNVGVDFQLEICD